jgi:hypothetical protein
MMESEFQERPFGGGGMFIVPAAEPPPPPSERLEIEPPPWSEYHVDEAAIDATELADESQALERPEIPPPPWKQEGGQ